MENRLQTLIFIFPQQSKWEKEGNEGVLVHNLKTHLFTSRGSLQLLKIFFRATVLIRLALTSEASSPLSAPSTPTHPGWNSRLSAQNLSFTFFSYFFFCQQHKNGSKLAEQRVGARRQRWVDQRCDSSSSGWGWVRSCSVFHRLLLGARPGPMFPLEVSVLKKLMKKCLC